MTEFRKALADLVRPHLKDGKFPLALVRGIDEILDQAGVPRDGESAPPKPAEAKPAKPAEVKPAVPEGTVPTGRLDIAGLRVFLGLPAAGSFDSEAGKLLLNRLANREAPGLSDADYDQAAKAIGVPAKAIRAVRKVEVREDPFDADGRPTILYERHVFTRNCSPKGRFNAAHPAISGGPYGRGGYGAKSAQYGKLVAACALDPEAALRACSWGAFQVLGENAVGIGYGSTLEMVAALTKSEAAHLDSFLRFLKANRLIDKLRACRAGDPASCIPFVKGYNGSGYAQFGYHTKLADALK